MSTFFHKIGRQAAWIAGIAAFLTTVIYALLVFASLIFRRLTIL